MNYLKLANITVEYVIIFIYEGVRDISKIMAVQKKLCCRLNF